MPRSQDLTLLVLKGHLLLEEQFNYFLDGAARDPGLFADARLTYMQKLQVVRALSGMRGEAFRFAKELNVIRNTLAHHADVSDLPHRIDTLLHWFNNQVPKRLTQRQRAAWLRSQLAFFCGAFRGYAEGFQAVERAMRANQPLQRTSCASR